MLLPEALWGWGIRRAAVLDLTLGLWLLHVNVVPIDTQVRSGKGVILGPEASEEGEPLFLGLVQLCMVCTGCSLVGHDWEENNTKGKFWRDGSQSEGIYCKAGDLN